MKEIWKDIPGYEGLYLASNLGRIKSLTRKIYTTVNVYDLKERILKQGNTNLVPNYKTVGLCKNAKQSIYKIHKLVFLAFNPKIKIGKNMVIDHINNKQEDNRIENLQLITKRQNNSKDVKSTRNCTSKYVGVSWWSYGSKWTSRIKFKKKYEFLGYFKNEIDAHNAYQKRLKEIISLAK